MMRRRYRRVRAGRAVLDVGDYCGYHVESESRQILPAAVEELGFQHSFEVQPKLSESPAGTEAIPDIATSSSMPHDSRDNDVRCVGIPRQNEILGRQELAVVDHHLLHGMIVNFDVRSASHQEAVRSSQTEPSCSSFVHAQTTPTTLPSSNKARAAVSISGRQQLPTSRLFVFLKFQKRCHEARLARAELMSCWWLARRTIRDPLMISVTSTVSSNSHSDLGVSPQLPPQAQSSAKIHTLFREHGLHRPMKAPDSYLYTPFLAATCTSYYRTIEPRSRDHLESLISRAISRLAANSM